MRATTREGAAAGRLVLRRLRDWWITKRTLLAISNRECRHDGREPMCEDCTRNAVGW